MKGLDDPTDFLMTRDQVADVFKVTTRTVDNLVRRGELKAVRIGGQVRFWRSEVRRYLDRDEND